MKDKEQTITDISIHVAALSASFKPAPDARHTTHWFTPMKSSTPSVALIRVLRSPKIKFIKPCTMPATGTRTAPDPQA